MNRIISGLITVGVTTLLSTAALAASLADTKWQTVDDKTGDKKAIVLLSESSGQISGKIVKIFDPTDAKDMCTLCSGSLKDQPVLGLKFLTGFKTSGGNVWTDGKVIDPENGKTYSGKMTLSDNGQSLELRGYVGAPIFGRTQTWTRVK